MKYFSCLFIVLIFFKLVISSIFTINSNEIDQFQQFIKKYGKIYTNEQEKLYRKSIFQVNLANIFNSNCDSCGITKYSDLTQEEIKRLKGGKSSFEIPKNLRSASRISIPDSFPKTFDWRDFGAITSVKDQGLCGDCWAYSTTAFFQSQLIRRNQAQSSIDLSEQYLFSCDSSSLGCDGGFLNSAMDLVLSKGILSENQYLVYSKNLSSSICQNKETIKIKDSSRISKIHNGLSQSQIITLLLERPLNIGLSSSLWQHYSPSLSDNSSRTFRCPSYLSYFESIDHTALLIGYTQSEWIIKNQWGSDWGIDGYIYISRQQDEDCGIGQEVHTLNYQLKSIKEEAQSQSSDINTFNNSINSKSANTKITCQQGQALNIETKTCEKSPIIDCIQFQKKSNYYSCQKCNNNSYLSQGLCVNLTKTSIPSQSICSSISNCESCSLSSKGIIKCQQCANGYSINQATSACQISPIQNCQSFCKLNSNMIFCLSCSKGFSITNKNKQCQALLQ